jgi:hypothetical protein
LTAALSNVAYPWELVAADDRVFWRGGVAFEKPLVRSLPFTALKADAAAGEKVVEVDNLQSFAVTPSDVFVGQYRPGAVRKVPRAGGVDGGASVIVAGGFATAGLVTIAGDDAYWVDYSTAQTGIRSCPVSGCGANARIVARSDYGIDWFTVDDAAIYWVEGTTGTIWKVAK